MFKMIYTLVASGGSYEDAREHTVAVSFDKSLLEVRQAEEVAKMAEATRMQAALNKFMVDWDAANPRPPYGKYDPETVPNFQGINQKYITPEMRTERKAVMDRNQKGLIAFGLPYKNWATLRYEAMRAWPTTQGWNYEDLWSNYKENDTSFEIEEVEFLE